jgi:hypothetical protein
MMRRTLRAFSLKICLKSLAVSGLLRLDPFGTGLASPVERIFLEKMVAIEIIFLDFVLGFLIVTISFPIVGNQTQRKRNPQNAQKKSR